MTAAVCACGKVRYRTRREAKQAASQLAGRGVTGGVKLWAYRCDGGFWHLTSQSRTIAARARAAGLW